MSDKTGVTLTYMSPSGHTETLDAQLLHDPVITSSLPFHEKINEAIKNDTNPSDISFSLDIEGTPFAKQLREWMDSCNDLLSEIEKKLIKKNQQRTNCMRRGLILSLSIHSYNLSLTNEREKWKNIFKAFEAKLYRTKRKCFGKVVSSFYKKYPSVITSAFPCANACQQFPWWDHRFINKENKEITT